MAHSQTRYGQIDHRITIKFAYIRAAAGELFTRFRHPNRKLFPRKMSTRRHRRLDR